MFYKIIGSFIIITYFYSFNNKKIQNLQTTEYIHLWDNFSDSDISYSDISDSDSDISDK